MFLIQKENDIREHKESFLPMVQIILSSTVWLLLRNLVCPLLVIPDCTHYCKDAREARNLQVSWPQCGEGPLHKHILLTPFRHNGKTYVPMKAWRESQASSSSHEFKKKWLYFPVPQLYSMSCNGSAFIIICDLSRWSLLSCTCLHF